MERYANLSGDSGVVAYEIRDHSIIVQFADTGTYEYDYWRPGQGEVEEMKELAQAGDGLNTYINKYVRDRYARRII